MDGQLLAIVSHKETEGVFALILYNLFISEIFQILLVIKTNIACHKYCLSYSCNPVT